MEKTLEFPVHIAQHLTLNCTFIDNVESENNSKQLICEREFQQKRCKRFISGGSSVIFYKKVSIIF